MDPLQIDILIKLLKSKGIHFENGLTDEEVFIIEHRFSLVFPPDLKQLLQKALPVGGQFVNWRKALTSEQEFQQVLQQLAWPLEGMLFDIKNNNFWNEAWGNKPNNYEDQATVVQQFYSTIPILIPIYSHRYIAGEPKEPGNPIFSVHQTDIIYYGFDLAGYFANEFKFRLPGTFKECKKPKEIKFWSGLAE